MNIRLRICLLLIIFAAASSSVAQDQSNALNDVQVAINGDGVAIEVELNTAIQPTVAFARNPDRLIADFPDVTPRKLLQRIPVGTNGVSRVRVGLNRANPPITRIVVDLDSLRPYGVEISGNKVLIRILTASEDSKGQDNLASAAENANGEKGAISELSTAAASSLSTTIPQLPEGTQVPGGLPFRQGFKIKGIAADSVYLDGGSNSGLQKGMRLIVRDSFPSSTNKESARGAFVAELRIIAVATNSAVAEVREAKRNLKHGDWAVLSAQDAEAARIAKTMPVVSAIRLAPRAAFLPEQRQSGDRSLDNVDRTRMQGRIGMDYSGITSSGSTPGGSTQVGLSLQSDMTHILGTHWNLEGYWRGRINRHSQFQEPTIEETLNKTYTMQIYYDNPDSAWVAGFGRLYLPWAVSLDTIDGGYLGRKLRSGVTAGVFAGSTPDLTSWDYAPDHRIAGSFVNFSAGSYDAFHFSSTSGLALSTIKWRLDRPYLFFENEGSYKDLISVYHSLIADDPQGVSTNGIRPGSGLSRSYLTVHIQPSHRLSFDVYHNYFRDVPTAATRIVGTGLVDKLLFQGVNAGVHFEPVRHATFYTTLGRSEKTGDQQRSLNQMYGLTLSEIARTGVRADFHYSKFDSNFGKGNYRLLSLSRQMNNHMFWNVQLGSQDLISPFTADTRSRFVATSMDVNIGRHSFLQSGYTFVNGTGLNYRQWYLSWGYRIDRTASDVLDLNRSIK